MELTVTGVGIGVAAILIRQGFRELTIICHTFGTRGEHDQNSANKDSDNREFGRHFLGIKARVLETIAKIVCSWKCSPARQAFYNTSSEGGWRWICRFDPRICKHITIEAAQKRSWPTWLGTEVLYVGTSKLGDRPRQ
jgi:hypothetical protein